MKKKLIYILAGCMMISLSCEQEPIVLQDPAASTACNSCPAGASSGTVASFAKFVAIGNGFVAGFQAGALFNNGQSNSMAKLLAGQLACAGGGATFNQPDIGSVNGYNLQSSIPGVITLGRLVLFDPDGPTGPRSAAPYPANYPGAAPVTCPSDVPATPALPAPYDNADLPTAFGGDKAALNNFGVPLLYLGQTLIAGTGNPASPYYNPLYARFASSPGTSTIVGDALTAGGSFYLIWLGLEDALLYAATGATGAYPLTSTGDFSTQYNGLITTMLGANPVFKGVVGNIPSLSSFPYFTTVPWNTIVIDEATAASLTTNLANGYNAFLDAMATDPYNAITPAERDKRKLTFVAGKDALGNIIRDSNGNQFKNGVLLTDETLTDLSPYMAGPFAALIPYARARQATATDLVPLAAGSVLGTCAGGNPSAVYGVSYPVSDANMLIYPEIVEIETAIGGYNAIISAAVAGSSDRLALADVKTAYANLLGASIATKGTVVNGVTIASSFAPPAGIFSEDGLHPNNRGNAYTANIFIDAINSKFTAKVPKICINQYSGTGLPVNP